MEINVGDRDVTWSLTTEYRVHTSPTLIIFGSIDLNINLHIKRENYSKCLKGKDRKVHNNYGIYHKSYDVISNLDQ